MSNTILHTCSTQHVSHVSRSREERRSTHLGVEGVVDQLVVAGPVNEVLPVHGNDSDDDDDDDDSERMPRLLMMM